MTRRLVLFVLAVVTLTLGPSGAASAAAQHPSVVVVGVPGLRWDQVSATGTPTLWRLAHTGSVGSLSIRAADPITCPDEAG